MLGYKTEINLGSGRVAHVVEHLLSKHEALHSRKNKKRKVGKSQVLTSNA
jgi:hypothetical protein